MIPGGRHGEVGIPGKQDEGDGMGRVLPRYVGQHLLQSQSHPGCPVRRQILCQHGVGEIQQPDIKGRARHGETLLAQGGARERQDHRQTGKPAPGDDPMAARQQIGLHGRGEQAGIAPAPPLPQPGEQGQQPEGAQQGQLHGATVMTSLLMGWPV